MKYLEIILVVLFSFQLNGQILNGGFEEVEFIEAWNDSIFYPVNWYSGIPEFDGKITTDSYSGNYAMYLTSWYQGRNTIFFYNGSQPIWLWGLYARNEYLKGAGTPIQKFPSKLKAYYKFENTKPNDSIIVTTYLKKYLPAKDSIVIVGFGKGKFPAVVEFEELQVTINRLSNETPDSIIVQITTSDNYNFCEGFTECNFLTIDEISLDYASSTHENKIKSNLTIQPNPVDNLVKIESDDLIKHISIFNAIGIKLNTIEVCNNIAEIDMINYPEGMYLFHVTYQNNETTVNKVIKKNR